jgi:hypothetical protein
MRPALLASWLFLAVGLAGCSSDDDDGDESGGGIDAAPSLIVEDTRAVAPGDIVEGAWEAGPADRILLELHGTGPFDWNIHGHAGDETTTIIEELDRTDASHDFTPPAAATWNLLIANRAEEELEVTVHMELYGDVGWDDWGE